MLDRITSMQVFVKVVATGSFTGAGRALCLSQTMVTKHINALETRLGSALFHRSTRKLSLTEAGRLFLDGCQKILPELEEIEQTVTEQRREPRGRLRLNAPVSFAIRYVAPLLPDFSRRYPLVTVELGVNDRTVDLIEEGWDLTLRIRSLTPSSLRVRKLADIRMVVCAAPSYLEQAGTPTTLADLSQHACLGYTLGETTASASRWSFGAQGEKSVTISGPLCANNGDVLREAAIAGQGLVYQPTFIVADALRAGTLKAVTLDMPPTPGPPLHAVYAPGLTIPLKVRAMIDFLATQYGPVPPWDKNVP
ncbi:LysR substrate-binding domain-containing protein [Acetobacter persici]|uniref:LysR family transcriptional regulator n=1 Tax=Acetobacter persici TaxID=1076596 RepID=UPI0039EB5584